MLEYDNLVSLKNSTQLGVEEVANVIVQLGQNNVVACRADIFDLRL